MKESDIARVCYEANRALQNVLNDPCPSQPWDTLDPSAQAGFISGVRFTIRGGYSPRQQHEEWLWNRRRHGWRYGPRKNEEEKTHPSLVPYKDLPEMEQLKDKLFLSIVSALGKS